MSSFTGHKFPISPFVDGGRHALRLSSLFDLADLPEGTDGDHSSWVHFAPYGTWRGHEKGTFTLNKKVFENIVERFDSVENDLQVDYNHDSIREGVTGPRPAAGWIKALEIRGDGRNKSDGLWGFVEWGNRAWAYIKSKGYRYTSPVIDFEAKDRKTNKNVGPELFNAALTNDPFLDGQVPLAFERLPIQMEIKIKDGKNVDTQTHEATGDKTSALQDDGADGGGGIIDKIAQAVGLDTAAVEAILLEKLDDIVALVAGAQSGEGTPADEAVASDNPQTQVAQIASDRWSQAQMKQIETLNRRIISLEKTKSDERAVMVAAHVDKKINEGVIVDSMRQDAIAFYTEDFDRAEKIYCSSRPPIGYRQSTNQTHKPGNVRLSDVEEESVRGLVACGYKRDKATQRIVSSRKDN